MGVLDELFHAPQPYKGQKYADLKKQAQSKNELFEDPQFPATDQSLFFTDGFLGGGNVVWKRPKDLCKNPRLFVDGASAGDVSQGKLGNCWFVAACASLAGVKELWDKVIPEYKEQEWNEEKAETYAGIFHFRFWRFGQWQDVVIDDRLPTINDQLIFIHSAERNEFWSAMLEKAYAKLHGTYEALDGGNLCDALEDFTGGVGEVIDLKGQYDDDEEKRHKLFKTSLKEYGRNSLMSAAIAVTSKAEMEARTDVGLVKGHAYSITCVRKVYLQEDGLLTYLDKFKSGGRKKIYMVRLRNPWGEKEWNGAFSDNDPEWEKIPKDEREEIGLIAHDDGEFWMNFEDFCKYFSDISICRLINTSYLKLQKKWHESVMKSAWNKPDLAGGCINNRDTFLKNPQFMFSVNEEEDEVLIQLSQEDKRHLRGEGGGNLAIGFFIMKVEMNRKVRLHRIYEKAGDSPFMRSRSLLVRETFKRGRYAIIPSTFNPGEETKFMIRIFASSNPDAMEAKIDVPKPGMLNACMGNASTATVVTIKNASGLQNQDKTGGADPYCLIMCEGEKIRTNIIRDTLNPTWNLSAIFYRKKPELPIKIHIWNDNKLVDQFMGKAKIQLDGAGDASKTMALDLTTRKRDGNAPKPGKLHVSVQQTNDFTTV